MATPIPAAPVPTVVLVEDHPAMRRAVTRLLEAAGVTVLAVETTAADGLAEVVRLRPDVAVVDNELPDGDGLEVCRAIRAAVPDVAVVVHSARPDGERARAAGAAEFVAKSAYGAALVEAVRRQASRRPGPTPLVPPESPPAVPSE